MIRNMVDHKDIMPKVDLPVELLVDDNINASILNMYSQYPCKIKAAIFALCISGEIIVTINLKEYKISACEFVTVLPDSFIQIHHASEDTRICFLGFSSQFITYIQFWKKTSDFFALLINRPVVVLPDKRAEIYRDTFSMISRMGEEGGITLTSAILQSIADLLLQIILEIYRANNTKRTTISREQEIMGEFIQLAFENYKKEHQVTFYARAIGLTLSHFCATISKASGKTAQEIIARLIILDAKAQLKGSSLHVNQIALSLGFTTPTTFNRYFRKYVGMTPEQYRLT